MTAIPHSLTQLFKRTIMVVILFGYTAIGVPRTFPSFSRVRRAMRLGSLVQRRQLKLPTPATRLTMRSS